MKLKPHPDLFDLVEAEKLRNEGFNLAMNADRIQIWKAKAEAWLNRLPLSVKVDDIGSKFTADDLIESISLPDSGTNRNNVIGAVFASWRKSKRIRSVGFRQSTRTARHAGVLRVWEKL